MVLSDKGVLQHPQQVGPESMAICWHGVHQGSSSNSTAQIDVCLTCTTGLCFSTLSLRSFVAISIQMAETLIKSWMIALDILSCGCLAGPSYAWGYALICYSLDVLPCCAGFASAERPRWLSRDKLPTP